MNTDTKLRIAELNGIVRESLIELVQIRENEDGMINQPVGECRYAFATTAYVEDDENIGHRSMAFGTDFLEFRADRKGADISDEEKSKIMMSITAVEACAMQTVTVVSEKHDKIIEQGVGISMMAKMAAVKDPEALAKMLQS